MIINPYENAGNAQQQWLKSNFHTHAGTGENTCGALEINEVIRFYEMAGYGVLTLSNHDLYSDLCEYRQKTEMLLINGFEYSQDPHMLCIGGTDFIKDPHQEAINECNRQGGFTVLCHPHWQKKDYWPLERMDALHGYLGIEIMNSLIFRLNGTGLATDTWDYLLSQGKLVWGFGSDDFHRWFDMAKAWNMILADKSIESVMDAIRRGRFYVSTGLYLNGLTYEDGIIRVSARSKDTYVDSYRYIFIGKNGRILKDHTGEDAEYRLDGSEAYVRVQVAGEHGAMLWTQPLYDDNLVKRI